MAKDLEPPSCRFCDIVNRTHPDWPRLKSTKRCCLCVRLFCAVHAAQKHNGTDPSMCILHEDPYDVPVRGRQVVSIEEQPAIPPKSPARAMTVSKREQPSSRLAQKGLFERPASHTQLFAPVQPSDAPTGLMPSPASSKTQEIWMIPKDQKSKIKNRTIEFWPLNRQGERERAPGSINSLAKPCRVLPQILHLDVIVIL